MQLYSKAKMPTMLSSCQMLSSKSFTIATSGQIFPGEKISPVVTGLRCDLGRQSNTVIKSFMVANLSKVHMKQVF